MSNIAALNKLYQTTIGRDVDKGGFDYWTTLCRGVDSQEAGG